MYMHVCKSYFESVQKIEGHAVGLYVCMHACVCMYIYIYGCYVMCVFTGVCVCMRF
jgi:hypothetical protein